MKLTVGQAIVEFLNNQYIEFDGKEEKFVKGFFTLFGHGNVLGLGQALEQDPKDFLIYQGRNEQGMAHSAIAFSKQKLRKQIFAVTSSVGPGAANMVTAAGTATANNIPVLFFPGDTYATRQPDPVLQQIEQTSDLTISTNDAFKPVSKYFDRITRPEQIMTALINAMRVLTDTGDTGAVVIALPQDVQCEAYNYPEYFFKKRIYKIERVVPTKDMISEGVKAIISAKRPFIICGGGVKYSEAGKTLEDFIKKYNIPLGETQAGKSAISFKNPMNMGGIGVTGGMAANTLARDADLIIGLGTRFTDFTSGSKELFNSDARFLNISTSKYHAMKFDAIQIIADVKVGIKELHKELDKTGYRTTYNTNIQEIKKTWIEEQNRLFNIKYNNNFEPEVKDELKKDIPYYSSTLNTKLTQTEVLGELQNLIDEDAIVVGSSGSLPGCMQRIWNPKKENTYHFEYGYSCMGYEICGALGVKIAEPEKEIYAMVGDGSFLMLHSELITSLQMNKKINILLFDNSGFGCINNLQMSNGMGSFGTEFRYGNEKEGNIMTIDFAKVAEGYGCKTYKVNSIETLRKAIESSKQESVSTLLDIKILPKTMTTGYSAWWNVNVAEVSKNSNTKEAYANKMRNFVKAKKY
ncbi:MAG: 3D-(3,5/4)-trihydroxycyclohexane-1,2-dione acylhydrolase (decyclizing) [Lachnospirales bacterium]